MRIVHLSDLHLGKRVNEFSMLEDQAYILSSILRIIDDVEPAAVIVAGDVYDKPVPPAEAVELFDDFLWQLARRKVQVFVVSGNPDSPERIAFASRLIDRSGIHLSPVYNGQVAPISLEDEYGPVFFYMLPFVKPTHVRRYFEEQEIGSYTDALRVAVDAMAMDKTRRNVLVTHQFVTGATRSESEDVSVGGTDNVDASVFDGIDYVALGHIHGPQYVGEPRIRYSGTPLKYSFSEAGHVKSVTVATLGEKGNLQVETIPLTPRHDLRELRGFYSDLVTRANYEGTATDDYLHITLTDEEDIPDVINRLRVIYPNLMKLDYDNRRTRAGGQIGAAADVASKTPLDLVGELYEQQNGQPLNDEQTRFTLELIEKIWEE